MGEAFMTLRSIVLAAAASALLAASGQAIAAASKVSQACDADFHKLCPAATPGRGAVMRCVKTQLSAVAPDCKAAVQTAQAARAARKAAKAAAASSPAPSQQ
jgi:hypothetical protein